MTDHEPRITRAQKRLKPQPAWVGVYESYEPSGDPWPGHALPIILLGQGLIWAEGGHPNVAALCQIMAQTDTGVEIEMSDEPDQVWEVLVESLSGLAWGDTDSKFKAFFASAAILADSMRKVEITQRTGAQSEVSANEMLGEVFGTGTPVEPGDEDSEPMMMDGAERALEELRMQLSDDSVSSDDKDAIAEYIDQVENGRPDADLAEES